MKKLLPRRNKSHIEFNRKLLPLPANYYREQGLKLIGGSEWKSAICPFHKDTRPSLRLHLKSGAFKCMACGVHGGDILSFHMQLHGLKFSEAVNALNAWSVKA